MKKYFPIILFFSFLAIYGLLSYHCGLKSGWERGYSDGQDQAWQLIVSTWSSNGKVRQQVWRTVSEQHENPF